MSFTKDKKFIADLENYINESDVKTILDNFSRPIQNANINKRTGRKRIGVPETRPRKILKEGSLNNYKSVILKFAKYKGEKIGREAPVTTKIISDYNSDVLENGKIKFQTHVTNIRILNKYVTVPILNQELKKPRAIGSIAYSNKPQLTHDHISATLKYAWHHCQNRDHVYKLYLLYYTGLRSAEAQAVTYRDVLDACAEKAVILRVRKGKNKTVRNVFLFKGAPTAFFHQHLLPYLNIKMSKLLSQQRDGGGDDVERKVEDFLDREIFEESSYQSCLKAFRKALKYSLEKQKQNKMVDKLSAKKTHLMEEGEDMTSDSDYDTGNEDLDEDDGDDDYIKGAGLHSIRSDYSTRALRKLCHASQDLCMSLKTVGFLLGHTGQKHVFRHYINLGYNFRDTQELFEEINCSGSGGNEDEEATTSTEHQHRNPRQFLETSVFKNIKCGATVHEELKNKKRSHGNLNNIVNIFDNNDIIPKMKKRKIPMISTLSGPKLDDHDDTFPIFNTFNNDHLNTNDPALFYA